MQSLKRILLMLLSSVLVVVEANEPKSWAEVCKDWDDWDKPAPPFQVFANIY